MTMKAEKRDPGNEVEIGVSALSIFADPGFLREPKN